MAINKVEDQNGQVLLDLTGDTVSADTLYKGAKAHDKFGNVIVGEAIPMEWHDVPTGATLLSQLLEIGFYSIKTSETFGDIPDGFVYDGTLEVLYHEHAGHQILRDSNGLAWARYIFESDVGEWVSYSDSDVIDQILNRLDEHDNDISRLDTDNKRQDFQIADLKNIVYDIVIEDEEYTYDELDAAPIPTHVSDGTNHHKVFDGAETMLTSIDGRTAKVNQLYDHSAWSSLTDRGVDITNFDDGHFTLNGEGTGVHYTTLCNVSITSGHVYLLYRDNDEVVDAGDNSAFIQLYGGSGNYAQIKNNATVNGVIWTAVNSYANGTVRVRVSEGTVYTNYYVKPKVVDLTMVYGAGNEPTDVDTVLADNPWILTTNEVILGELYSSVVSGVHVNGANLWNEAWEAGGIDASGQKIVAGSTIRSKDFIKVLPNTVYWCVCPATGEAAIATINFYDEDGDFISRLAGSTFRNASFTTPSGCYYILFRCDTTTSYTSGIAFYRSTIALPYRPYKPPFNFTLPSSQELRSAGTAHDVIRFVEQGDGTWNVDKVENADRLVLNGTEPWVKQDSYSDSSFTSCYSTVANTLKAFGTTNLESDCFPTMYASSLRQEGITGRSNNGAISINISTSKASTQEELKAWLAIHPVVVHFEKATPTVTTLMAGLTEPDIATLIELYGSVEIVGNTQKQYAKPNLKTIIQVERAVEP